MREFFTIGEVAQIKQISIKSLRYYEQIGILVPVKINPETGYRYYNTDQLLIIDMIRFLSAMTLPLKQWNKYLDDANKFHLQELIEDSRAAVEEEIRQLQMRINRLELAARGLRDNQKYLKLEGYYERSLPLRNVLRMPTKQPGSLVDFHKKLSILFGEAKKNQVSANYPVGLIFDYQQTKDAVKTQYYVYLEIYEQLPQHPFFFQIPEQTCRCIRQDRSAILNILQKEADYIREHPNGMIISADCLSSPIQFIYCPTELQFY